MPNRLPTSSHKRVYIVDPDRTMRETLGHTFTSLGYDARLAASCAALSVIAPGDVISCVLVDISLRDLSAFALQRHLRDTAAPAELVFMTGEGDIAMAVTAMKRGAVDFLTKPLRMSELLPAVDRALLLAVGRRDARKARSQFNSRVALLTPRERQVLALVLEGKRNKQIAAQLASQESTVKVHRSRLMRKLEVRSLADLLRVSGELGAEPREAARGSGGPRSRAAAAPPLADDPPGDDSGRSRSLS